MKKTYAIFQKEIKHFFYSPIAYIVIAAFTLIAGIFFYLYLSSFVEAAFMDMVRSQQFRTQPQKFNINLQIDLCNLRIKKLGLVYTNNELALCFETKNIQIFILNPQKRRLIQTNKKTHSSLGCWNH